MLLPHATTLCINTSYLNRQGANITELSSVDNVRYRPDATSHTRLARSILASVHALACTRVCFTREFAHTRVCRTREFTHTRVCCAREFTRI